MSDASLAFVYQYLGGGCLFSLGLYFGWRGGYVGLGTTAKRRNLFLVVGGLILIMSLQAFLQFYAPMAPQIVEKVATPLPKKSVGTPLDYGVMIAYFSAILLIGTWFGRNSKSTKDFFFGVPAFSHTVFTELLFVESLLHPIASE